MKVELKYWRFVNSNDAIFNTDPASLKCDASSFKMSWIDSLQRQGEKQTYKKYIEILLKTKYKEINIIRIN